MSSAPRARSRAAAWLAATALVVGTQALAETLPVAPGADIQATLDRAAAGDTVLLSDGVHALPGPIVLRDGVVLRGETRDGTVLDGGGRADTHLVFPSSIADERTRVSDLTVTGGSAELGGAILVDGARSGAIVRTRLHGNRALHAGSAIFVSSGTAAAFRIGFNVIHHNGDPAISDVHAVCIDSARPLIHNNTIAYNDDNGIFVFSGAPGPRIVSNILARNGIDFAPPVVVDPVTLEPVSGVAGNIGRGICYFAFPSGEEPLISHNVFIGNARAALLVDGQFAGDYEDPRDLEALAAFIDASGHYPRGTDDGVLFADGPAGDFRIQPGSIAVGAGDGSLPGADGFGHVGAEGVALDVCALTGAGRVAATRLRVRAGPGGRGTLRVHAPGGQIFVSRDALVAGCAVPDQGGRRAFVSGTGRLNGHPGFSFVGFVDDAGPGARRRGLRDGVQLFVGREGDLPDPVLHVIGALARGNLSIHGRVTPRSR